MPRIKEITYDLADADADGIAASNDSSGTSVTLDGVLTSSGAFTSADAMGRIIIITDSSTSDQSDVTFTVVGTDANDNALSEVVTGPTSAATVATAGYFKTVTSITISAAQGGSESVNVGTRGTTLSAEGKLYVLNNYAHEAATVQVDVTGTANVDIQETVTPVLSVGTSSTQFYVGASFDGITAGKIGQLTQGATALKVIVNSYSTGAEVKITISQTS